MKLLYNYRKTKPTTRIIVASVLLGLIAILTWQVGQNVFLITGATAGLFIFLEMLLAHTRFFVSTIITGFHLIALSFFCLTLYSTLFGVLGNESTAIFVAGAFYILGLALIILSIIICYKIAPGALWFNLLISYALYYIASIFMLTLPTKEGDNINLLLYLGVVFVTVLSYPFLRKLLSRKRKALFDFNTFPIGKKFTVLSSKTDNLFKPLQPIENMVTNKHIKAYRNRKAVVLVLPLAGERQPVIENNFIKLDDEDVTWVLEYLLESAKEFSRIHKISQKHIIPVLLVENINLGKSLSPIKVKSRKNPDKAIGTVLICKADKTALVVHQANDLPEMNNKELTSIINK